MSKAFRVPATGKTLVCPRFFVGAGKNKGKKGEREKGEGERRGDKYLASPRDDLL